MTPRSVRSAIRVFVISVRSRGSIGMPAMTRTPMTPGNGNIPAALNAIAAASSQWRRSRPAALVGGGSGRSISAAR
jgi:hypothetical protein